MDFIFQMFAEMFELPDYQEVNEYNEEEYSYDEEMEGELQPSMANIFQYVDFH